MNTGAFGENFPYSNFHELNMDWIVKIAKDFLDQYTSIQETIDTGLESLNDKAVELEELLQAWYDTHSQDIATMLTEALLELNTQLTTNMTLFDRHAEQKATETIATIPDDYTTLFNTVSSINDVLTEFNSNNLLIPYPTETDTVNGITWTWNGSTCSYSGTSTSPSYYRIYYGGDRYHMPSWMTPGKSYVVDCVSSDRKASFNCIFYKDNDVLSYSPYFTSNGTLTIPSDAEGVQIRLYMDPNITADGNIKVSVLSAYSNKEILNQISNIFPLYVPENNTFSLWTDMPSPSYYNGNPTHFQDSISENLNLVPTVTYQVLKFISRVYISSPYSNQFFIGMIANNNVQYWTRVLTSNYHLTETHDTTDRASEIQAILNTYKVCHLAPGTYYIGSVLTIPTYGKLCGEGFSTKLIRTGETGSAIRMQSFTTVSDLYIRGSETDITPTTENLGKHGILWMGTYDPSSPADGPFCGTISNVMISDCSGAGIYTWKSGRATNTGLNVVNVTVQRCGWGIAAGDNSEFSQWTNLKVTNCGIGLRCTGGNQIFANCNFSSNIQALDMEGTTASVNNSHGSFTNCIFDHSGSNTGYAMRLKGMVNGEIFSSCQIFFGKIRIEDCAGIRIIGANFGRQTDIAIINSTAVIFSDCQMRETNDTPVTITGGTAVLFNNCYYRNGTQFTP